MIRPCDQQTYRKYNNRNKTVWVVVREKSSGKSEGPVLLCLLNWWTMYKNGQYFIRRSVPNATVCSKKVNIFMNASLSINYTILCKAIFLSHGRKNAWHKLLFISTSAILLPICVLLLSPFWQFSIESKSTLYVAL